MSIVFSQILLIDLVLISAVIGKYHQDMGPFTQSLIKHILLKYFTQEGPVLFLLSDSIQEENSSHFNAVELPYTIRWVEDITLQIASENYLWPMMIQHPKNETCIFDIPHKSHILFTNTQIEDFKFTSVENLKKLQKTTYWNPRSNFLLFSYGKLQTSPKQFAVEVLNSLRNTYNIRNAVLLIFTGDKDEKNCNGNETDTNVTPVENITTIYAYTLFPYLNGSCNEDVTLLIGKWTADNTSENSFQPIDLFPNKIPKIFLGCVLNIGSAGPEPGVIKESYKSENGKNNKFVAKGLSLQLINLFATNMNMTPYYQEPVIGANSEQLLQLIAMLILGHIDILTGIFPLVKPLIDFAEPSAPMFIHAIEYLVPCPKRLMKTEKILTLFHLSSWIGMGLVFIFVSVLFWILSNYPTRRNNFTGFNMLAQCFSAAWAVLLGISVSQLPVSLGTRSLFIIYVWYCFAISTVFQAYFTTYLVEPGYEARLETLDDVYRAGLKYAVSDTLEGFRALVDMKEMEVFEKESYNDFFEGIESVMFKRKVFTTGPLMYPIHLARSLGINDESTVMCYLDESLVTWPVGALITKGHPLLHTLNTHIKRCIEGGLLEGYWSKIKHETNLKANKTDENSEFVVFSLTHLSPLFILLIFGYILSVFSFLCELILFRKKNKRIDNEKFQQLSILRNLRILEEAKYKKRKQI
ncbi:hypothetical protein L9F63_017751 [Diploptera punctata]|uniref:Ionotropic glutamate receptor C-terminal domain-containing protein n=1 Tax=Diploptera punctata TaxID=6984 RepID=A0AAD8EG91_DIPPU|nr:hypothetical protein L9F63_017751 [Diploptera punctata]